MNRNITRMTKGLKQGAVWFSSLVLAGLLTVSVLVGLWPVTTVRADLKKADFALLDQEPTVADKSIQCSAMGPLANGFVINITMTNRTALGGTAGVVRVRYHDRDFVDYEIPVDTTIQISLVGGGTPGTDDAVQVTNGGSGAHLTGQMSILAQGGAVPIASITGTSFCTTTPSTGTPPLGTP